MALIMKEKVVARTRAIKVMAYATQGEDGKGCCERFVEVLGLKSLFSAFMGKVSGIEMKVVRSGHVRLWC